MRVENAECMVLLVAVWQTNDAEYIVHIEVM